MGTLFARKNGTKRKREKEKREERKSSRVSEKNTKRDSLKIRIWRKYFLFSYFLPRPFLPFYRKSFFLKATGEVSPNCDSIAKETCCSPPGSLRLLIFRFLLSSYFPISFFLELFFLPSFTNRTHSFLNSLKVKPGRFCDEFLMQTGLDRHEWWWPDRPTDHQQGECGSFPERSQRSYRGDLIRETKGQNNDITPSLRSTRHGCTCLVQFDHLVVARIVQADSVVGARSQEGEAIAGECEAFDFAAFLVVSDFVNHLKSGRVDDEHTPIVSGSEDLLIQMPPCNVEKLSANFVCENSNWVRGELVGVGGEWENLNCRVVAWRIRRWITRDDLLQEFCRTEHTEHIISWQKESVFSLRQGDAYTRIKKKQKGRKRNHRSQRKLERDTDLSQESSESKWCTIPSHFRHPKFSPSGQRCQKEVWTKTCKSL